MHDILVCNCLFRTLTIHVAFHVCTLMKLGVSHVYTDNHKHTNTYIVMMNIIECFLELLSGIFTLKLGVSQPQNT